ncbi:hypothetical protein [Streptomyces noursei]|uniref:hypothetical protein n=1 Tax=Streptomyces noursei TaxID=1971 RepID=UPI001679ABB2|nr:hypothetical protein [Streptomyces noursei]MCZ1019391.1 hypothetical protein [Streptomyces noursei]GGX08081.1 hypothetical protein GCM10010341_32150 [Streptomyces noursei]
MFRKHVVRFLGALAALTPWLVAQFPDIPWEALIPFSLALLGGAEVAQRVEDQKTDTALSEPSPDEAAAAAHLRLALLEIEHASKGGTLEE